MLCWLHYARATQRHLGQAEGLMTIPTTTYAAMQKERQKNERMDNNRRRRTQKEKERKDRNDPFFQRLLYLAEHQTKDAVH